MQTCTCNFRLSHHSSVTPMEEMGSNSHVCSYSFLSAPRNPIATCVSLPWGWGSPVYGSRKQLPQFIVFVSHCRHVLRKKKQKFKTNLKSQKMNSKAEIYFCIGFKKARKQKNCKTAENIQKLKCTFELAPKGSKKWKSPNPLGGGGRVRFRRALLSNRMR